MTFIYKFVTGNAPEIASRSFLLKDTKYNLRSKYTLEIPNRKTINYGINTPFFKGCLLWNSLPNHFKEIETVKSFKRKIKTWKPKVCTCKICS